MALMYFQGRDLGGSWWEVKGNVGVWFLLNLAETEKKNPSRYMV